MGMIDQLRANFCSLTPEERASVVIRLPGIAYPLSVFQLLLAGYSPSSVTCSVY